LSSGTVSYRTYGDSLNPPILRRKELLLPREHPRRSEFEALSTAAEKLGLFDAPTRIGFLQQWLNLVHDRGYQVIGHEFVPIANADPLDAPVESADSTDLVARHLTALVRYGFSAPIQALARYGLIHSSMEVFDYGCGRGDDVRGLTANGIVACGWDPHYMPNEPKREGDVVNLGFVINVIEDFAERVDAVRNAYGLAKKVLAVAAMLASQAAQPGRPYRDGFLTSRNTFQKYYSQEELASFLSDVLQEAPVPVGPGVFFVFRDKDLEQRCRASSYRDRTVLQRLSPPEAVRTVVARANRAQNKYEANRESLDALWNTCLRLGRQPSELEADQLERIIGGFGSLSRALKFILSVKDAALLDRAREARIADLSVYLALAQFEKRAPYKRLEPGLQRDVRSFFGDHGTGQRGARELLFSIADTGKIRAACVVAAQQGLGWLVEGRSLQLHTSLVERLPTMLRIYVACGLRLYGDVQSADLLKIHMTSGKLTLMKFDDFEGKALPRMIQRVKVSLRSQDVDVFDYGEEFTPPYLFMKSRYINEEFPHYAEQLAFDEKLDGLKFFDFSEYGPSPSEFEGQLEKHRWATEGFELRRSGKIPNLDALCGRYLTYRHLIECGETQRRTRIANLPTEPESYTALYELASKVLDPVIEYFGTVKLTYGFCSIELAGKIPAGTAPQLDQHAAHERNRKGRYVCARLGAAVDFLVEHEDMSEVAEWIAKNTRFDRIYYYGSNRPIHVSFSPNPKGEIVEFAESLDGKKRVPRVRRQKSNVTA
jgi:DNA phosphorothioation-associated putative methyltransferase